MTEIPQNLPDSDQQNTVDVEGVLRSLRRKEGTWVEWGQACQTLQKMGYNPQSIFEETGFEPIQQNQIVVAAQVYASILAVGVSDAAKEYFGVKGSDVLYELRILTQPERAAMAELAFEKKLDMNEVHEAAKAVKEYSRLVNKPEGFTDHPGDAIAYQIWRLTRQKSDLQERSRLIAKGLRFAHSDAARKKIEQLLTDFSVVPATPTPALPVYRLEATEELPRLLPVIGKLPLTKADLQAAPLVEEIEPFRIVKFSGTGAWVAIPGWQVILAAEDPVAILCDSEALPVALPGAPEEVMVVVDRSQRDWDPRHYFVVDNAGQLQIQWFEYEPEATILGQVILVMRPKKVLDDNYTKEIWQIDE
ncbi:RuBisCO accumulation factor 1 [Leptothermofonsia sp. ETS-13]|uniref:RuBisCO accumulation factor 1 n=1 Tax=Leptothermofonsia sp. ETS-13 TaxID=3035696 RepID=UPI003B9E4CF2